MYVICQEEKILTASCLICYTGSHEPVLLTFPPSLEGTAQNSPFCRISPARSLMRQSMAPDI
jgi:hypothetical protein